MKRKTLGLLACPTCRGELSLNDQGGSGSIETGTLVCARCQRQCPIKEGIPHFIEPEELTDDRVQEVSIGPGINLPYLFETPGKIDVYGLDILLGQLHHCQDFCRKRGLEVDLFLGTAEALPFRDNAFEATFHVGGINFFGDKKAAIDEMIRVAKPGTKIAIADENEKAAQSLD